MIWAAGSAAAIDRLHCSLQVPLRYNLQAGGNTLKKLQARARCRVWLAAKMTLATSVTRRWCILDVQVLGRRSTQSKMRNKDSCSVLPCACSVIFCACPRSASLQVLPWFSSCSSDTFATDAGCSELQGAFFVCLHICVAKLVAQSVAVIMRCTMSSCAMIATCYATERSAVLNLMRFGGP